MLKFKIQNFIPYLIFTISIYNFSCTTCTKPPDKELVKSPDKVYEFFRESIRYKEYGNAYEVLSPETKQVIQYEEFYLAFSNFFAISRIILGAVVDDVKVNESKNMGTLTVRNDEFGISRNFRIKYFKIRTTGLWVIDISHQELDELVALAKDWYNYQLTQLGERKYSIPAWWRFKPYKKRSP